MSKNIFIVEHKIPIPEKSVGRRSKYPFGDMHRGDSFIFSNSYSQKEASRAHSAVTTFKRQHVATRWKFTIRKTKEGQLRIWRIE